MCSCPLCLRSLLSLCRTPCSRYHHSTLSCLLRIFLSTSLHLLSVCLSPSLYPLALFFAFCRAFCVSRHVRLQPLSSPPRFFTILFRVSISSRFPRASAPSFCSGLDAIILSRNPKSSHFLFEGAYVHGSGSHGRTVSRQFGRRLCKLVHQERN